MAQKKLSNGRFPRAYGPSPHPSGAAALAWAQSIEADPSRSFVLVALDTDVQFMSVQAQRECDAWIVSCPDFLPGAEAQRLLARFDSALARAGRGARLIDTDACFITFDDCQRAGGSALASAFVSFNYELPNSFWSSLTHYADRRRERRRIRRGQPPMALRSAEAEEWSATCHSLEERLLGAGFRVAPASWILAQYAGGLEDTAYRERARAYFNDRELNASLQGDLPRGESQSAKTL